MSTPSPSLTDDEHGSYHPPGSPSASGGAPASAHATTSKRGRKPAPGSRAAREALRKSNHSIIEKRRREKINETMSALRTLLADGYKPPAKTAQEVDDAAQEGGAKGKKAQDFKLEVLTRSVEYIHQLLDRISTLESQLTQEKQQQQQQPAASSSRNSKSSEAALGKRKRAADDDEAPAPPPPRLPSISSLLNPQLPSPPMSVPMRPTAQDIPPILTLPAPNKADGAPWTPDEEHVASLLLNISSPTDSRRPKRVSMTPGGMLGIRPASL